jgi:membrane-associated phospholipid phosphatase
MGWPPDNRWEVNKRTVELTRSRPGLPFRVISWFAGAGLLIALNFSSGVCEDYLSAEEVAAIGAGSAGMLILGESFLDIDRNQYCDNMPNSLDRSLMHILGGKYYPGKSNFLDSDFGSIITPAVEGTALTLVNLTWPQESSGKDAAQDLFLYLSGLSFTKGVTSLSKGLFARHRPMACLYPDIAEERRDIDESYDHHSFFSGHVSSSFFAATFVNHRLRTVMRQRMSGDEYRNWRWAPPTVLFGWATFVGWSRIEAYKHYFTDVVAGAAAGYLIGELFYLFARDKDSKTSQSSTVSSEPLLFRVTIRF